MLNEEVKEKEADRERKCVGVCRDRERESDRVPV